MTNKEYQNQMKEHEKRMEEIDKAHWTKLSAEWEVQKPVTFMRAVMHKVDKLIEDMEIEIRDRE